ncbi:MAG: S41 family peptidase [Chloroflexi bacterium]|nr:MAG: S41 family peptidase [Chloroflexota bacterium]RLT46271.1 MAG: S41 family peptidase [Chloroflexota bacterium]
MFDKISRATLALLGALFVGAGVFSVGFVTGSRYNTLLPAVLQSVVPVPAAGAVVTVDKITVAPAQGATPEELQTAFKPFWETWELLQKNFVDRPLDTTKLVNGAIQGMMRATGDRNTSYMTPDEQSVMQGDMSGELEGIGAEVDGSGDLMRIVAPMKGSPAEAAGVRAGDLILEVDGVDMSGLDSSTVISKVRGKAGTKVKLLLQRAGASAPVEVEITRYKITIPMVEGKLLTSGVAYVEINQFGSDAEVALREKLKELLAQNPPGLIIDLRNNPGGYLDSGVAIASELVADSPVMVERLGDGSEQEYAARPGGLATKIKLVVLINAGSASASEIVAGAVQDYKRGLLVGEKSYGKGTVQTWLDLSDGGGAVRITFARWLTPKKRSVDNKGLMPDVLVPLTEADQSAGLDPQLAAAEAVLLQP